jgi:hypothetical protein
MTKLTENETELRKEISDLMTDLMLQTKLIKVADEKSMIRQGERLINAHNERLKKIMAIITADKQKLLEELIVYVETYNDYDPEGLFYRSEDAIPLISNPKQVRRAIVMDDAQISDNKFSRFDDELIEKYFNDKGKKAIQDYIASYKKTKPITATCMA